MPDRRKRRAHVIIPATQLDSVTGPLPPGTTSLVATTHGRTEEYASFSDRRTSSRDRRRAQKEDRRA